MRLHLHVNNLIKRLCSFNFSLYKLFCIIPIHTMGLRTVYKALYQALF